MNWRTITDWAKKRQFPLHLADWLGRGRGRLRLFDHVHAPPRPRKADLSRWEEARLAAVWIGHATVLMRVDGVTILTDPVLFNRVGFGLGLITGGPRRLLAPAVGLHELPPVDLLLISHAHFDHLDRPTLDRLSKRTPVITAHQTSDLVRDLGFTRVTELRWGESTRVESLTVTAHKVRHWGARAIHDSHRGYNAYLLESARQRVLYGGDCAYCDYFQELGRVDLAIFGIGGYDPYVHSHATPEQVMEMAGHVRADAILPMHHSTFRLSAEPVHEPMERLLNAAGNEADRIVVREVGGQWASG